MSEQDPTKLIPEMSRAIFGDGPTTPSITVEIAPWELIVLHERLTNMVESVDVSNPYDVAHLPYVAARLDYFTQFLGDDYDEDEPH